MWDVPAGAEFSAEMYGKGEQSPFPGWGSSEKGWQNGWPWFKHSVAPDWGTKSSSEPAVLHVHLPLGSPAVGKPGLWGNAELSVKHQISCAA